MSCSSCGKKKKAAVQAAPGATMVARAMVAAEPVIQTGLLDKRSRQPIGTREPLVMNKPGGGWIVNFTVNGVPVAVAGETAAQCIAKERQIIAQNGLEDQWDEEEAWRQANLQWLNASHPKNHRINIADLSPSAKEAEDEAGTGGRNYTPADWGSIAWRWLGLLLARDRFDQAQFVRVFREVVELLSPASNPSLGCKECYMEASKKLAELQSKPPKTMTEARTFLFQFHNEVNQRIGKELLTFEQAEKDNFWR